MKINKLITAGIIMAVASALALDYVEVINVKARQRYPWNGLVDIDFELDSKATEPYMMKVTVFDNVGKTNLPVKTVYTEKVSQKANPCMVTKDTTRIVWNAAADLPDGFKCTNVLVTCQDTRCVPTDKLYCVIDLSAGSEATSYPVTYLDSVPAGGWTDEYKTTKLVLRRISAGTFMMGSPESEIGRNANEDYHKVTLTKDFYISVFEMTESQYGLIMGKTLSGLKPALVRYGDIRGNDYESVYNQANGIHLGWGETTFSWPKYADVYSQSLVGRLRNKTGLSSIDLPTEAQWEMACRGFSLTAINTGYDTRVEEMNQVGRYNENVNDGKGDASFKTYTYVGCYKPNSIGLYDMLGNAREWCRDAWKDNLGTEYVIDPIGNSMITIGNPYSAGGYESSKRVVKGGGFFNGISDGDLESDGVLSSCRSAYRTYGWSKTLDDGYDLYTSEGVRLVFLTE